MLVWVGDWKEKTWLMNETLYIFPNVRSHLSLMDIMEMEIRSSIVCIDSDQIIIYALLSSKQDVPVPTFISTCSSCLVAIKRFSM